MKTIQRLTTMWTFRWLIIIATLIFLLLLWQLWLAEKRVRALDAQLEVRK